MEKLYSSKTCLKMVGGDASPLDPPLLTLIQGRAQKFEKGGPQYPVSVSTENISEDQNKKKGLHVTSNLPLIIKSRPNEKGYRVLRCPVSTVPLTGDIY